MALSSRSIVAVVLALLLSIAVPVRAINVNCSASDPINTCIRIGYFRWVPVPGVVQAQVIVGYTELIDWNIQRINTTKDGRMSGVPVYFVPYVVPVISAAAADVSRAAALWVPTNSSKLVDFVILPSGSNWADAMLTFEKARIPAIAGNSPLGSLFQCPSNRRADLRLTKPCTSHNSRRFQFAHGISNAGEQYFQPWVGLLKLKKAKSLAIIQTGASTSIYPGVTQGLLSAAADYALDVVYVTNATLVNTNQVAQAELDRIVERLVHLQPDGVALASVACAPFISAFKRVDYMPNSLVTILCTDADNTVSLLGDDLKFVTGTAQWGPTMNGNDYLEDQDEQPWALFPHKVNGQVVGGTSPMQFVQMWQRIMSTTALPSYAEASILAPFTMLEGAIELTMRQADVSVPDPVIVNQQLQLYYQPSYFGILSTNRYGANQQKALIVNQRDASGVLGIISPATSAALDFIYPAPKFSERVYVSKMLDTPVEWIVIAVMSLASVFTLLLMGYLFKNRHLQAFQAAGLPFYLLMGLGCLVAYGSVLVWGVENNTQTCNARIWMWTLCFHMFVDPLLASSWRIARIFSQKLKTVKLTNRVVGLVSLAIFTPQLLINILWQSIAPLQAEVVTSEPLRPAFTSFTTCAGGQVGLVFTGVTLGYSGLLLMAACFLAYKVRKAYRLFNDARPIAMSICIFSVTAAIILVIQIALNKDDVSVQKVLFGLRSVGVILAYQTSLALLYFRRILGAAPVTKYGGKQPLHGSDSDSDDTNTRSSPPENIKRLAVGSSKDAQDCSSIPAPIATTRTVHVSIRIPGGDRGSSKGTHTAGSAHSRPLQPISIVRVIPGPPMPSHDQFDKMEDVQKFSLLQQFHSHLETLHSQVRAQNLRVSVSAREAITSLPGTPEFKACASDGGQALQTSPVTSAALEREIV